MQKKIILVTGATGAQGGSVAHTLLTNEKFAVRCLTRNASSTKAIELQQAGAEVVEGTLDDPTSLISAMKDCYGVFGLTNFWEHFDKELVHGKNLADAVKKSGIEHFIYSSLPGYKKLSNGEFPVPHCDIKAEIEEYSTALGLKATYVHIAFYYENFLSYFRPQPVGDGSYQFGFPQGDTPLSMVTTEDFGPVVAAIFENPGAFIGRTVGVVAEDSTCTEYATTMSKVLGKTVRYNYIPREIFASFGFPGAEELANMFEVQRLYIPQRKQAMQESYKLNPKMQSFEDWLTKNKQKFAYMNEAALAEA